jgi:uncharacterized protein (TIGR03083 family)
VEHAALIEALRREGAALGAVPIADIDVPTCPDWSLPQLIHHVGGVHRFQAAQLRAEDPERLVVVERSERPPDDELSDWYHDGLMTLVGTLDATPADRLCPTMSFGPQPATFWARRAAHETAVHRWDAEAAVDRPTPLDTDQAVDALDELFEVGAVGRFDPASWEGPDVSIHLHATDVDGEWLIRLGGDGLEMIHAHEKGDVAARGPASDLTLMMVGRVPPARLEIYGDAGVLDRWFRSVRL